MLVLPLPLAACTSTDPQTHPEPALPPVDCAVSVRDETLPVWARGDFVDGGAPVKHVEGLRGAVVGVLFGYPLSVPKRATTPNKILWIPRNPASNGAISIDAQLNGLGSLVHRDVGFGGGQSIIDLPIPGCWRMTLRWAESSDTVDVPYVGPTR